VPCVGTRKNQTFTFKKAMQTTKRGDELIAGKTTNTSYELALEKHNDHYNKNKILN
tara:strand:+ start:109 stop:276 length:168 start_codon:yes stop_codon:yes gene_type:complete